ncbi:MAG: FAD-dependent oxidoreductase [Opitutaceae bacterium]|nr:FAD-dependent oxidoreductase [Opitutaceae bacterium]
MTRENAIERLRDSSEEFDFLIIGGGATGLGAAVDASSRGYRVALIEQADFASGTSSCSTKLVHGGVRYLRQGELGLVRSALRERALLLKNAPHLAWKVPFVIPNYAWWEGPYYRLGLGVYDRLAGGLSIGRSRWLSRAETVEHLPTIETGGLSSGVLYYDGQFDDARLAVTLARTAVGEGAALANYCRCVGLLKEQGCIRGARVRDEESGHEFEVRAKVLLNATGVFVDVLRRFDEPASKSLVAASQGIHIVLPRRFLPGNSGMMIPRTDDGRVLFAIPWRDRVVVGTTDTGGVEPSMTPVPLDHEIEFVLAHARKYLTHDPSESDVLSLFAGLRPLVADQGEQTASLSRAHTILVSKGNLVTVTGGKWTTYRKMAQESIDCLETVGGMQHRLCKTEDMKLYGAVQADALDTAGLEPYGSDAHQVRALARMIPGADAKLHPDLPYIEAEVIWHARNEMARTVEDVLARRTRALVLDAAAAVAAAPRVASILAKEMGRDPGWVVRQLNEFGIYASRWLIGERAAVLQA